MELISQMQTSARPIFQLLTSAVPILAEVTFVYHMHYTEGENYFHAPGKINLSGLRIKVQWMTAENDLVGYGLMKQGVRRNLRKTNVLSCNSFT